MIFSGYTVVFAVFDQCEYVVQTSVVVFFFF